MSIRITTGMIANQYNNNLNKSRTDLSRAQSQAYTYRAFDKVSDDPFAAGQTFQVRRATEMNEDYQSNLDNVNSSVTTAESTLRDVYSILTNANTALKSVSADKNSSNNSEIGTELLNMRDTILADMNQQYADQYLFAGAGTSEAPFSTDADGNLLYRGINVDTGENTNGASATISYQYPDPTPTNPSNTTAKSMQINFGAGFGKQMEGYSISLSTSSSATDFSTVVDTSAKTLTITVPDGKTKSDLQDYLNGKNTTNNLQTDLANPSTGMPGFSGSTSGITVDNVSEVGNDKILSGSTTATGGSSVSSYVSLSSLANEKVYVDIGLGLKTNTDGSVMDQTAYNAALPGINFLGYGTNSDGVSNNAYNLLTQMANILKSGTTGTALTTEMEPYTSAFTDTMDSYTVQQADVGSKMTFLTSVDSYLTDANTNLQTKDENVEYVDPTDAIMNYYMQQYSYQAALQTGNSILQPTLLDFMK